VKDNFIPLLQLLGGAVAMFCAIMYISHGTVIPVISPLSLGFFMALTFYTERQNSNRRWMKVLSLIISVLCAACAVAQIFDFI